MQEKKQIIKCEHCGNKSTHTTVFSILGPEEILDHPSLPDMTVETYYFLAKCGSCSGISLFWDWQESDGPIGDLAYAHLLYPVVKEFGTAVPALIAKDYVEATKVKKISPIAFAVLVRKSLESICKDQKATGRDLKEKLDDLAKKGIIPESLSKMANAIRYLGNIGAHASEKEIDSYEAETLNDFFVAIIEYVYIGPAKLNILSERMKKKGR